MTEFHDCNVCTYVSDIMLQKSVSAGFIPQCHHATTKILTQIFLTNLYEK